MKRALFESIRGLAFVFLSASVVAGETNAPGSAEHISWATEDGATIKKEDNSPASDRSVVSPSGTEPSAHSQAITGATRTGSGLIISPTFDSSITNDPNAAAIEAMINRAIAIYESLFSDPITVSILFRYSTTKPNGTPIGSTSQIALSNFVVYSPPWSIYIN